MEILYRISNTSFLQNNNLLWLIFSEEFFNFSQSEKRIAHGNHVFVQSGWN